MRFQSMLHSLKSGPARTRTQQARRGAPHKRPATCKLLLELLEDRTVPSTISLVPSEAAPQLVGEPITWTATVTDGPAAPVYQFSDGPADGPSHVVRDFSRESTFTWAPMQEGSYTITVTVKDGFAGTNTESAFVSDLVNSRVTGSQAVITPMLNPLVAVYSAAPGPAGMMHVEFSLTSGDPSWRSTNTLPVVPGESTNFLVAGMLPSTTYEMRHVLSDGTSSAPLLFTTGAIPASVVFPSFTVIQPPGPGSDLNQDMLFQVLGRVPQDAPYLYATDLTGHVTWYYDPSQAGLLPNSTGQGASLVPGGTVLVMGTDGDAPLPGSRNILREIDLAGNPLRETNVAAVNAQLTALGHDIIYSFTHDVQRLPNGQTAVIGLTERTVTINGTSTDYIGMMVVVLDADFQVTWAWDAFDHLDVNSGPVLGEIVQPGSPEPSAAVPRLPAVDWLHVNAVSWSPADGNLVLSIRQQDWVIKIDYQSGEGDGHVIWRLGQDGDFTVNSTDPNPWFSHQHNAHYIDDSTLILFDNGNTRRASDPNADSRGQVWTLDEQTMTATLAFNVDLGNYSNRLGSAQTLSNGNYSFTSGAQGAPPIGQSIEVLPDGTEAYVLEVNMALYRSFRMRTLYEGIEDVRAGAPQKVESVVVNDGSAQRSMINSLTVTFSAVVHLDPGAFELVRQGGGVFGVHVSEAVVDRHSVDTLTFVGAGIIGGSLADGHYTLIIHGDQVHDRFGQALDGAGTGEAGSDRVDTFFRLFGDGDGDGRVDLQDLLGFGSTLGQRVGDPGYLWYFDYNGDGRVDLGDLAQLLRRLRR
jgi:arylsulfate sulfotransferase